MGTNEWCNWWRIGALEVMMAGFIVDVNKMKEYESSSLEGAEMMSREIILDMIA